MAILEKALNTIGFPSEIKVSKDAHASCSSMCISKETHVNSLEGMATVNKIIIQDDVMDCLLVLRQGIISDILRWYLVNSQSLFISIDISGISHVPHERLERILGLGSVTMIHLHKNTTLENEEIRKILENESLRKTLKGLNFAGVKLEVTKEVQDALAKLNLEYLNVSDCGLTDLDQILSCANMLNALVCLDASGNSLGDKGIVCIGKMKNLKHLSLSNCGLRDLDQILNFESIMNILEHLNLSCNSFRGKIIASLGELKNIRYLHLSDCNLLTDNFRLIFYNSYMWETLEYMNLSGNKRSDFLYINEEIYLKSLRHLDLGNCGLGYSEVGSIFKCKDIQNSGVSEFS